MVIDTKALESGFHELIQSTLLAALAPQKDAILAQIVSGILERPSGKHSYSNTPLIKEILADAIVKFANDAVANWIEANKAEINTLVDTGVRKYLTPEFVADRIQAGIEGINFRVSFKKAAKTSPVDEDED